MTLCGDAASAKLKEDGGFVFDRAARWKVLKCKGGNAGPVQLEGNPVAISENIRDGVGLAGEEPLSTLGGRESFGQAGNRTVRRDATWHFRNAHIRGKQIGQRAAGW
jgi:hypothetical protein